MPLICDLLDALQADASLSNQLAPGVSRVAGHPPAARETLEEAGRDPAPPWRCWLAPARRPPRLNALSEITLDRQGDEHLLAFEARAVAEAQVRQCWRVSPGRTLCWWSRSPTMAATRP